MRQRTKDPGFLRDASLLMAGLLVLGVLIAETRWLNRLDLLAYDTLLPWHATPVSPEVVVVTIDERSLGRYGRWPWSRQRHAELLDKLRESGAKAVGLDVLLIEPEAGKPDADQSEANQSEANQSEADRALTQALTNHGRTVLVIAPEPGEQDHPVGELLPMTALALASASQGHVDVELDQDGLVRRFYLYAGLGTPRWPAFAWAMQEAGGQGLSPPPLPPEPSPSEHWMRHGEFFIPFATTEDTFTRVSFIDVVDGVVPPEALKDKFLLVGVTAQGLGDALATPASPAHQRMPGIILNAHMLSGMLQNKWLSTLAAPYQQGITWLLVALTLIPLMRLPVHRSLFVTIGILLSLPVVSLVAISQFTVWFAPAQTALIVLAAWIAWASRQTHSERKRNRHLQKELAYYALHQPSSGLPNERLLEKRLTEALQQSDGSRFFALMVIHLEWPIANPDMSDGLFESELTAKLAETCQAQSTQSLFIAHLNSGHMALLGGHFVTKQEVEEYANTLPAVLNREADQYYGKTGTHTAIGICTWVDQTYPAKELLKNARVALLQARLSAESPALSQARLSAEDQICLYTANITEQLQRRSQLEQALYTALKNNELELHYQPQVDAQSEKIIGVEALLRWQNAELGRVSPDSFIPVAEETGLISLIGTWVIETACQQQKSWTDMGLGPIRMAVNVSPLQFIDQTLDEIIAATIHRLAIQPSMIELEITESTLMTDLNSAKLALQRIKTKGMELAIDDFGTGFSSLNNLRHFPFDRLKIDQSFTREIDNSPGGTEITLSIIDMARRLNLSIIAEGVETRAQADFLKAQGCQEFQGYLFSRPLPAQAMTQRLKEAAGK